MENIIIRKAKPGDEIGVSEMIKYGLKTKNFSYIGTNKPWNKERIKSARKEYASKNPNGYAFVAIDKLNNKLVGACHFGFKKNCRIGHVVELGWFVHPDYQKRGIGFNLLKTALKYAHKKGFKRAEAEIVVKNKASLKIAKRCGFKIEGIKRKGFLTDEGKYLDMYILGRLF